LVSTQLWKKEWPESSLNYRSPPVMSNSLSK
jgi:hypothetical protein